MVIGQYQAFMHAPSTQKKELPTERESIESRYEKIKKDVGVKRIKKNGVVILKDKSQLSVLKDREFLGYSFGRFFKNGDVNGYYTGEDEEDCFIHYDSIDAELNIATTVHREIDCSKPN